MMVWTEILQVTYAVRESYCLENVLGLLWRFNLGLHALKYCTTIIRKKHDWMLALLDALHKSEINERLYWCVPMRLSSDNQHS